MFREGFSCFGPLFRAKNLGEGIYRLGGEVSNLAAKRRAWKGFAVKGKPEQKSQTKKLVLKNSNQKFRSGNLGEGKSRKNAGRLVGAAHKNYENLNGFQMQI